MYNIRNTYVSHQEPLCITSETLMHHIRNSDASHHENSYVSHQILYVLHQKLSYITSETISHQKLLCITSETLMYPYLNYRISKCFLPLGPLPRPLPISTAFWRYFQPTHKLQGNARRWPISYTSPWPKIGRNSSCIFPGHRSWACAVIVSCCCAVSRQNSEQVSS